MPGESLNKCKLSFSPIRHKKNWHIQTLLCNFFNLYIPSYKGHTTSKYIKTDELGIQSCAY